MTRAVPFTFETTFDAPEPQAKRPQKRSLTQAEIEEIERQAFAAGVASTADSQVVALQRSVEQLMNAVRELEGKIHEQLGAARAEATTLAYIIARKLAETLISERPVADIEMLIGQCLEEHKGEAAIVLRVNDTLHDPIRDAAAELKAARGFDGRVVVIGEPRIAVGDCAIEWADGGLERNMSKALKDIEAALGAHLAAESDRAPDLFSAIVGEMDRPAQGKGEA